MNKWMKSCAWLRLWVPVVLIVIVGAILYSNTLEAPFLFDDVDNIVENPHIRMTSLTFSGLAAAAFQSLSATRPLANVTFALNYYVGGYDVTGYHLVNIGIHLLTGLLLFFLFHSTLATPALRSRHRYPWLIAFSGALLWLAHPLHTQSVTYIVQRMSSMATMFSVLSLLLYVRGRLSPAAGPRRRALFAGSAGAWILALGSKQIAAALPAFMLLYEWYFFRNLSWEWLKSRKRYLGAVVALSILVAGIFLLFHSKGNAFALYAHREFTMGERLLTQFRVLVYYASLLAYPHPGRLSLEHDFPLSHSLLDPVTTLLSLGTIIGALAAAIRLARTEPLFSFALLWFFGNLLIESSILPLELVFEHRTYLPSIFLAFSVTALTYQLVKQRWVAWGALIGLTFILGGWTYERNKVWSDKVTFWTDCAKKAPHKARPYQNLGLALYERGKMEAATRQLQEALRIDPQNFLARGQLGIIAARQGKVDEAIAQLREALRIEPTYAKGCNNLGRALLDRGNLDEAITYLARAVTINPDLTEAHYNLGRAWAEKGQHSRAVDHFSTALRLDPHYADAHMGLGIVYGKKNDNKKAIYHFTEALRIDPARPGTHYNLGLIFMKQGNLAQAREQFQEALRINPSHAGARHSLDALQQNVRE